MVTWSCWPSHTWWWTSIWCCRWRRAPIVVALYTICHSQIILAYTHYTVLQSQYRDFLQQSTVALLFKKFTAAINYEGSSHHHKHSRKPLQILKQISVRSILILYSQIPLSVGGVPPEILCSFPTNNTFSACLIFKPLFSHTTVLNDHDHLLYHYFLN